ncbi:hypothetical protein K9M74_05350 [Candidatus Woesearchaeota archaeon]|nr:hypothetical protein [Candidatus Woesearchaeota archaeon]
MKKVRQMTNGIYMIKPDAIQHRREIKEILESVCSIENTIIKTLNKELIIKIYPFDANQVWFPQIYNYFSGVHRK